MMDDDLKKEIEDKLGIEIKYPMAYEGQEGCQSMYCRRFVGSPNCVGWHCYACGGPSSQYGHKECHDGQPEDR
jgi:hypothetical protein